jgi:pimeloyl-ACP methyl ester carboxylesterase
MTAGTIQDTAYETDGTGPPLVLVHGMGLNRALWDWQLPFLTPHFETVRYDLLGHGDSAKPVKEYAMADFTDQLARLADGLGHDRFALAGFSLGGLIVQAFALAHPDRVSKLAILCAGHDRSDEERAGMLDRLALAEQQGHTATVEMALERWFTDGFAAREPGVIDKVRRWMTDNDPAVYPLVYKLLATGDKPLAQAIANISCPTLVLACEEDHGNSPAMARRTAELIPDARAAIVPKLRHMGLAEDPDAIARELAPFLQGSVACSTPI